MFISSDGTVKLGDMNVSKVINDQLLQTQTGTPFYASPEVWKKRPYDYKSDIWSLGCLLYEMVTLKPPFRSKNMDELFKRVTKGNYGYINQCYSEDIKLIIRSCLKQQSHMRPSTQQILNMDIIQQRIDQKQMRIQTEGLDQQLIRTITIDDLNNNNSFLFPKPTYKCSGKSMNHSDNKGYQQKVFPTINSNRTNYESDITLRTNNPISISSRNDSLPRTNREIDDYLKKIKTFVSQGKQQRYF